jgi:ABC-2 type transport system permease protein
MSSESGKTRFRWPESARIIVAIAGKDIVDAIKNKTTLTIIISVVIMAFFSQALPLLLKLEDTKRVVIYDAGASQLAVPLKSDGDLDVYRVPSMAELESTISEASGAILGLVIPADFDRRLSGVERLLLDGYSAHWADPTEVEETRSVLENRLTTIVERPVSVNTRGHVVYPQPDADGQPFMITITLVTVVTLITAIVVPQLMIEEKETHTMDVLLVSPATAWQVVAGKALAGMFYGLTAGTVILFINRAMVNHWGVVTAATLTGVLFAVALGLVIGSYANNQQALGLWSGLLFILLLVPMLLINVMKADWPAIIQKVIPWMPTVALGKLYRVSFSAAAPFDVVGPNLAALLVATLVLLAVIVRHVRRMDHL